MGRTTIDGLAVRNAGSSSRRPVSNAKNQRVVGGILATDAPRHMDQLPSDLPESEFLAPTDSFGLDGLERENARSSESKDDWSDLLERVDNAANSRSDELESTENTKKSKKRAKAKNSKPKKKRKVLRTVLLSLLVVLIIVFAVCYIWGDGIISRLTNGNSNLFSTFFSLMSEEVPFETDSKGRTNILVFGTEGYDMDGTADGGGRHDGATLTDSIMVISFDQKTKDVALLSLPRDLKVSMACYSGKINEVFTCNNDNGNNEEAGARALMQQAGQILGIDFQYWAHVNWASLVDIVDAIGGITVTLDEGIYDYNYTGVVIEPGVPTKLTGIQAVALSRARHGTTLGDFTRGNSQQKIVEGIAQKVVESGIGWTETLGLLNILGDNLRTNFSSDNIKAGVHLISGFDVNTGLRNVPLTSATDSSINYITTATINGISYVVPKLANGATSERDYSRIQSYVAKMFDSNPAVREDADLLVLNATGESGVAAKEQEKLEADGYSVYAIGDAGTEDCNETICLFALNDEMSATKQALEERYKTTAHPVSELPAGVRPGYADFVVIIGQANTTE